MDLTKMYRVLKDYVKRYSSLKTHDPEVLRVLRILLAELDAQIITEEKNR
jgi:hypothetical protein